jgi:hypothetical protein
VVRRKITAKRATPLLKSASLYSEVDEQGPASPVTLRVEQTCSELVFGMPAPWRILPVHRADLEGEQRVYFVEKVACRDDALLIHFSR